MLMLDVAAYLVFIALLVYAAVMDWRTLRISNKLIVAIMVVWLIWRLLRDILLRFGQQGMLVTQGLAASTASGVLAAIIFAAALLLFSVAYEAITHRPSMGGGDVKLMAASALFLGLQRGLLALMIACVASVVVALVYARTNAHRDARAHTQEPLAKNVSRETFSEGCEARAETRAEARAETRPQTRAQGIPFGPAIAIGCVLSLFL